MISSSSLHSHLLRDISNEFSSNVSGLSGESGSCLGGLLNSRIDFSLELDEEGSEEDVIEVGGSLALGVEEVHVEEDLDHGVERQPAEEESDQEVEDSHERVNLKRY